MLQEPNNTPTGEQGGTLSQRGSQSMKIQKIKKPPPEKTVPFAINCIEDAAQYFGPPDFIPPIASKYGWINQHTGEIVKVGDVVQITVKTP